MALEAEAGRPGSPLAVSDCGCLLGRCRRDQRRWCHPSPAAAAVLPPEGAPGLNVPLVFHTLLQVTKTSQSRAARLPQRSRLRGRVSLSRERIAEACGPMPGLPAAAARPPSCTAASPCCCTALHLHCMLHGPRERWVGWLHGCLQRPPGMPTQGRSEPFRAPARAAVAFFFAPPLVAGLEEAVWGLR